MCGIAGYLNFKNSTSPSEANIRQMLAAIRHRGPDQFGIYLDHRVGMGNARLSIVDLDCGQQPISNEDGRFWIVYNGEIFNHFELRKDLEKSGHAFKTHTDTEVLLHLYEEEGPAGLSKLNGQFAVAIWDRKKSQLFLARDRLGVRPLYYTTNNGQLIFGSEIKSLACHPSVDLSIDPDALDQIFTCWSALPPSTPFANVQQLQPGHYALIDGEEWEPVRYWGLNYDSVCGLGGLPDGIANEDEAVDRLEALLVDATKVRLRADVPVGSYLSGGLDSSLIATMARNELHDRLDTFSISFSDTAYDESVFQREMADFIGTDHQVKHVLHKDIAAVFPEVIWHTETPILRASPAPMFMLSKLVQESGYKVVLTGEGADEFLAGYDIFKEAKIRRFWAKEKESTRRASLFSRIYPDLDKLSSVNSKYLASFFGERLEDTDAPEYSHIVRWKNTSRIKRFFSKEMRERSPNGYENVMNRLKLPGSFRNWGGLEKSQYLEVATFLEPYLLSAQGDRVAMAHSVEGRFPFLDYRVIEYASRLPSNLRLKVLKDKYILREVGRRRLPDSIWKRPKKPYRAPIHRSFINDDSPDYVSEVLSASSLNNSGFFNPRAVDKLTAKIKNGQPVGETEEMALVGIISTQLLHQSFVTNFDRPPTLRDADDVKVCRQGSLKP